MAEFGVTTRPRPKRVDELIDVLGVNFPVYMLVTKCDLIAGFVEFFQGLDSQYREQMFGWTNPPDPEARFDGKAFDSCFGVVTDRLFRMRPWVESTAPRLSLRKAFLFPEEFAYLGRPLRKVLDVAFRPSVYQEKRVCRGVYFSSGTQEGTPLARALEEMAQDLNIPEHFGMFEQETELKAYFIKDLVSEQVLRDKEMTWTTWRVLPTARRKTEPVRSFPT